MEKEKRFVNCRERRMWQQKVKERDELIEYERRRADIAERRRDKDRKQRADRIKEIYAWAVLVLVIGFAIPFGSAAFQQFMAWAAGH